MINEDKLAMKLSKSRMENSILKTLLEDLKKIPQIGFNYTGDIVYITKISKLYHLKVSKVPKYCCQLCKKRRKTTAHHLIPKRAKAKNQVLKELRIKVCRECDRKIHPENLVDGKGIIERLNRECMRKDKKIKKLKERNDDIIIEYIEKRIIKLEKEVNNIHIQLKETPRKIHPAQKQLEGRIVELKHIMKNYKNILNDNPIENEI